LEKLSDEASQLVHPLPDLGRLIHRFLFVSGAPQQLVALQRATHSAPKACYWTLHVRQSKLGARLRLLRRQAMVDAQVGWIAAIIIGGVAGWLAEQFMKSEMGLLMNIVLGIVGAAVASAILSFFGIHLGGWIGYLIAGFIGAVLLIWIVRAVQGTRRPV
jgi:uncharacterized membrane protein YeaQ/YmgE (transglycosylase-associated protein family)